jgi:phosphotransferase system enzyme I (PtsP)
MPESFETESRKLLGRLRDAMADDDAGQERLDRIVALIAGSMRTEVCSIYLFRDAETLELCATEGLSPRLFTRPACAWERGWWAASPRRAT